jgi:hypothetical protein
MKISAITLLLLIPAVSFAQSYQNMSPEEMQQMQQMMMEMQSCMANIDQAEMKALEQRANQFEVELKQLCAAGKRDEAQATAISFGQEMVSDPTVQDLRKCSEMMSGVMPVQPYMEPDKYLSADHICD